jgi:AcrR family transcriptional regulator
MSQRLDAPTRRSIILQNALVAFAKNGYHETSMSDVADATGVTKPVLYQHFESKRDLYMELLNEVGRDLVATIVVAASSGKDGRAQTENGMTAYFSWVVNNANAFILLFGGAARVDDEFAEAVRRVESELAASIAPLIAVVSPEDQTTMAFGLVGMAEAVSRHLMATGQHFNPEQLGMRIAGLAWAGLRALGQPRNS